MTQQILRYFLTAFLFFISCGILSAQTECTSDTFQKGLRKNQQYTAPCDSMVVLNKPTFQRWTFEKEKALTELNLLQRSNSLLKELNEEKDSLIIIQGKDIQSLEDHKATTDSLTAELNTNLVQCIKNTDEAIAAARQKKIEGLIIGGIGGSVIGLLAGIFLF
ncbi:MAG: hypothetical protein WD077_13850 [Bacteroidia bacterium]